MSDNFLTGPEVDKRYGRTEQSRWRWSKDPNLGFPKPMKIRGRNYYKLRELEAWERRLRSYPNPDSYPDSYPEIDRVPNENGQPVEIID